MAGINAQSKSVVAANAVFIGFLLILGGRYWVTPPKAKYDVECYSQNQDRVFAGGIYQITPETAVAAIDQHDGRRKK